jgi:rubredoxin
MHFSCAARATLFTGNSFGFQVYSVAKGFLDVVEINQPPKNLKEATLMAETPITPPENTWKCSNCGNTVVQAAPPQTCPVCRQKCEFLNVTCYQPDCGFTGMDNRLKPAK